MFRLRNVFIFLILLGILAVTGVVVFRESVTPDLIGENNLIEEHGLPHTIQGIKKMVLVPKGTFLMGDDVFDDEKPIHPVAIDSFYMDETPVTYADFVKYVDTGGSKIRYWEYETYNKPNQPVTGLSWYHAIDYCNWRSKIEGLLPVYEPTGRLDSWGYPLWELNVSVDGYRLPTEAEFEYAARGGLIGKSFPWGDEFDDSLANYDNEQGIMRGDWWRLSGVNDQPPNNLGLYGMSGNVWHFCNDWYEADYYNKSAELNPMGPETGRTKVLRGGSWGSIDPTYLRVSKRSYTAPSNYNYDIGFRCVRPVRGEIIEKELNLNTAHDFYKYETSQNQDIIEGTDIYSEEFVSRLTQFIEDHYPDSIYFQIEIDEQKIIEPRIMAELITEVSKKYHLHPLFLTGIMASESGFGTCSFPRWFNNPMAYHWQNALMKNGLPIYNPNTNRNRKYKDLESAFTIFSQGIRRDVYYIAARKNLDGFHLVYVGYRADEWMYTISKLYKDVLGIRLEPDFPQRGVGEFIYTDWDNLY